VSSEQKDTVSTAKTANGHPEEQDGGTLSKLGLPSTLVAACVIALVEGVAGVGYGIFLIVRELMGAEDFSIVSDNATRAGLVGVGTAIMFLIFFGSLLAAGINLLRGGRWGRGLIVFINFLLLGCAYYAFTAGMVAWIIILAGASIATLILSFHPRTLRWAQERY